MNNLKNKKEIRKIIIQKRKNIPKNKLINYSKIINNKIIRSFNLNNKKIGLYFPINNEINLNNFLKLENINFYFPKIENKYSKNKMNFYKINSNFFKNKNNYEQLKKNNELIFENKTFQPKLKNNISIPQIIIIPLVAFNKNCFRLGYGGGFYDRYLKNRNILKIGIGLEFQRQMFHVEHHDIPLNYIFTEKRIYKKPCKTVFPI